MALSYIPYTLAHVHLPCPPTVPNTIPELRIQSDREQHDIDVDKGIFDEHALSFSYHSQLNILARSIHNGYTLELRPLDTVYNPKSISKDQNSSDTIHVIFPERISTLSEGCIVVSELDRRVYILVYTEGDVLYRLNFPLGSHRLGRGARFGFTTRGNEDWVEEWEIPQEAIAAAGGVGCWRAIDELNVVLGCGDGGIIRLNRSTRGINGAWSAHQYRVSTRFRLPSLFSSSSSDEQVVSLVPFESDDGTTLLYTFSRDRKLRIWNMEDGNNLKTIDVKTSSREVVLRDSASTQGNSQSTLLSGSSVGYLRVISHPEAGSRISHLVVIFLPSSSASSQGSFLVYRTSRGSGADISLAGEKLCSATSAGSAFRGFDVLPPIRSGPINSGWRLWTVWDQKGTPVCETIVMDDIFQFATVLDNEPTSVLMLEWNQASFTDETGKFDPAYFDNLLSLDPPDPTAPLENSDIGATFLEHLFLPGRFSILTLTTALEEYIEKLPRNKAYAEIGQSFPSLAKKYERIIGCDLEMNTNPQTGAPEVHDYRAKLKLQWLGVWARVRNLDTGSRWPLGTVVVEDQLMVVTREGFDAPIVQDACGTVYDLGEGTRTFLLDLPSVNMACLPPPLRDRRAATTAVAAAGRHIADVLSSVSHDERYGSALDVLVEELNFYVARPYSISADIKADEIYTGYLSTYMQETDHSAISRILSESPDVISSLLTVLDLLASTSGYPEQNFDDDLRFSSIGNGLISAGLSDMIRARYNLSRDILLISTFVHAEFAERVDVEDDFTRMLYRAFTTYQRYRVLLFVSEQTADELRSRLGTKGGKRRRGVDSDVDGVGEGSDDVDSYEVDYSLLHSLLAHRWARLVPYSSLGELNDAVSSLLSSVLSLDSTVWDNIPLRQDTQLAMDVLEDGHPTIAGTITTFYPESSGMFYVRARAYLDLGDIDEAVVHFENAASGCIDRSIKTVLPAASDQENLTQFYYRHVTKLFEDRGVEEPIVRFGNLALETAAAGDASVKDIWTKVFLASLSIGAFDKAYVTLTSTPHPELRRDFLGQLISTMCEANQVGELLGFGFVGFQKEVEDLLQFKARHSDPLRPPHYHQVLYSWHVTRGDYRSAADVMYQQAKRLENSRKSKEFSPYDIGVRQGSSYLAAINALSLLDKRQAWLANPLPRSAPAKAQGAKRRRVSSYIPEDEFGPDNGVLEVVTLTDVRAEYAAVLARLQLATVLPDFFDISGVPLEAEEMVGLFVQRGMFDEAQASAAGASVDLVDFFTALARRCVLLTQPGAEDDANSPSAAWLYKSSVTAHLQGPPSALCMRYLQNALTRHDSAKTNWKYREVVLTELFSQNQDMHSRWKMPGWLVDWEMERDPESLVARAIKWGWLREAVEWSLQTLGKSTPPELLPKRQGATDTPWNLFDRVVNAARQGLEADDGALQARVQTLQNEMTRRMDGLARVKLVK